jgi:hypothetical protein
MDVQSGGAWFGLDDLFWLTLLVLFLATLVGALLRRFRKDRCLRLLDDYHVTYVDGDGRSLWGDLLVSSQGVELLYDAPFTTSRGLIKTSHLVPGDELGRCVALCRTVHALTASERAARTRQIDRTFHPGIAARAVRTARIFIDMLRDAITKSLGMFVGAMAGRGRLGAAIGSRQGEMDELGKTLVGVVANAYEPLLERHIGKPVVVECRNPPAAPEPLSEFTGYLVEYTENFLAVFDVEQTPEEQVDLEVSGSLSREGMEIGLEDDRIVVTCTGPDALILRNVEVDGNRVDLDVTLFSGCNVAVRIPTDSGVRVRAERTCRVDLVCPRSSARVRFGSGLRARPKADWSGISPQESENG